MKILHFSYLFFENGNGITTAVVNQCNYENKVSDVKSKIFATNKVVCNEGNELYRDYIGRDLGVNSNRSSLFAAFSFLQKMKPDIVYFHNIFDIKSVFLSLVCAFFKIKYFVVPHSSLMRTAQLKNKLIKKIYINTAGRFLIYKASAICYLNKSEMDNSIQICQNVRRVIIPNGVKKQKPVERTKKSEGLNVLYFGRYDINHKGIDILINYISYFREYMVANNITLTMFGSGDIGKVKALVSELSLDMIVSINGPVFSVDKDQMFISHDVLVLTSRYEGLPIAVLESLSYGLPCILSENTNMNECIDIGAALRCDNKEDFINAIKALQTRERYLLASKKAYHFIDHNYSWEKIVKDRIEICKQILN